MPNQRHALAAAVAALLLLPVAFPPHAVAQVAVGEGGGQGGTAPGGRGGTGSDLEPPALLPGELAGTALGRGYVRLDWQPLAGQQARGLRYQLVRDGRRLTAVADSPYVDRPPGGQSHSYELRGADGAGNQRALSAAVEIRPVRAALAHSPADAGRPWAGALIESGARDRPLVALTFDDCYKVDKVRRIVETLHAQHAAATFFPVAGPMTKHRDLWADIARDFPIGNHTLNHAKLTTLSESQLEEDIAGARELIEDVTGQPMLPIVRPPYGAYNSGVLAGAARLGLAVVMWDVDTLDWKKSSRQVIVNRALDAQNGSIILLHGSYGHTARALPDIIAGLRQRGFTLVALDELLGT
jgi:peptidoglycan/xylan/chitin deacetylase (PgdA/CDA1 family)